MADELERLLVAKSKGDNRVARILSDKGGVPVHLRPLEWSSSNVERRSNACGLRLGLRQATKYVEPPKNLPWVRGDQSRRDSAAANGAGEACK